MSRMLVAYMLSLTLRAVVLAAITRLGLLGTKKAHIHHAAWTVVLCITFLMPIADFLLPHELVPAPLPAVVVPIHTFIAFAPETSSLQTQMPGPAPVRNSMDWWQLAVASASVITVLLLLRLALVWREVNRIRKESRRISFAGWEELRTSLRRTLRVPSLCESAAVAVPLTIGFWKPLLILPMNWREWDDWKLRAVLVHELTHVQRFDWAIIVLASLTKCLYWFNPLVWWLERKLSSLAEQASDEACVRLMRDRHRYAETLLHFAATTRHGNRWIGGVAMAQNKISFRIERVLELRQPGSGVLSEVCWAFLFFLAVPALYASAAIQSGRAAPSSITPIPISQFIPQEIPVLIQSAAAVRQQQTPSAPSALGTQSQAQISPQAPSRIEPQAPATPPSPQVINPDLVGEIRLILAPVDQANGEVRIQTNSQIYTGTAVWRVRNDANAPNLWNTNNNAFAFRLTGMDGRKVLFEDGSGSTFSYGCANCTFLVWESGVGSPSNAPSSGILFTLGADGKALTATCRAKECRMGLATESVAPPGNGDTASVYSVSRSFTLLDGQNFTFEMIRSGARANAGNTKICISVFGAVKADGTPFTDADCPDGTAILPSTIRFSTILFSVTR